MKGSRTDNLLKQFEERDQQASYRQAVKMPLRNHGEQQMKLAVDMLHDSIKEYCLVNGYDPGEVVKYFQSSFDYGTQIGVAAQAEVTKNNDAKAWLFILKNLERTHKQEEAEKEVLLVQIREVVRQWWKLGKIKKIKRILRSI